MEGNKSTININILDVLRLIKHDYKIMPIFLVVGALLGLVVAFSIPKVYKSTVILAPEETSNGFSGSISSLASMVGMNMNIGQNGDAIYPEIYPDVMGSTDFLVSLFTVKVTTKDKSYSADYASYMLNRTETPWWTKSMKWITGLLQSDADSASNNLNKKTDPFNLTKKEWELTQSINGNLSCNVDKKTNVITITVQDQDPFIAACMADTVKNRLQVLITDYRTKKARNDVKYLEEIYSEAKSQYNAARSAYAGYTEGHQLAVLESINQQADRLKSEMELRGNIYNTVAEQLQLAKAKVQEKTPAFTTIQNASVAVKHSGKPKALIIAVWMMIAFVLRVALLVWQKRYLFIVSATNIDNR